MNDPAAVHYYGDGDDDGDEKVSFSEGKPESKKEENMIEDRGQRTDRRLWIGVILLSIILVVNLAIFAVVLLRSSSFCENGKQHKSASSPRVANASCDPTTMTHGLATTESSAPVAPNWQFSRCRTGLFLKDEDAVVLDAVHGSKWPTGGSCIAYNRPSFIERATSYALSTSFVNTNSFTAGHPGLVYNYIDDFNYDFTFVRTHAATAGCGNNVDGNMVFSDVNTGGYKSGSWNTLRAVVSAEKGTVEISLNEEKFADCPSRHPQAARGGVLVLNGYGNIFKFKDVIIEKL